MDAKMMAQEDEEDDYDKQVKEVNTSREVQIS